MIRKMIEHGMNVVRINMSHAKPDKVRTLVRDIRAISTEMDRTVGILMDFQGPAIRTGELNTHLDLRPGDIIDLTVRGEKSEEEFSVDVNYDGLVDDIQVGDTVLVDNGEIHLKVLEKHRNRLKCEVLTEGKLGSKRHINLPGVRVNLPALTEKDIQDIDLGIEVGVDFFAMSFVREADDVKKLKSILEYRGATQRVVAKLEDQEAIRNVDEIIDISDAIMVARGDLGIEVPYEELPIIQRRVVKHCLLQGKPVIVATHMLESMIENPSPTRAEITDVANAVYEQADAIMLSGESTIGKYPLKCLDIMTRISKRIELSGGADFHKDAVGDSDHTKLIWKGVRLAEQINAAAIFIFTHSGRTAQTASGQRPDGVPIYAFTESEHVVNQLTLLYGVRPFFLDDDCDLTHQVEKAMKLMKKKGLIEQGQTIVAVSEIIQGGRPIDTIQMQTVP